VSSVLKHIHYVEDLKYLESENYLQFFADSWFKSIPTSKDRYNALINELVKEGSIKGAPSLDYPGKEDDKSTDNQRVDQGATSAVLPLLVVGALIFSQTKSRLI
jgi:hypothetical protein